MSVDSVARSRVRVAVVNDHPIVAAGLARLLELADPHFTVTGHVQDLPGPGEVDLVLFDTFANGPDETARLQDISRATQADVVVFGWQDSESEMQKSRGWGAVGYLSKTADGPALAERLRALVERRVVGEATLTAAASDGPTRIRAWPGQEFGLSEREAEVLCLICEGLTNETISGALFLSINSVKTYIRTAYRKIGVTRRSEAVLWGVDHGMRKPAPRA